MAKAVTKETEAPEHLLPTPPIGWNVQYFKPGDTKQEQPVAAQVTAIEGPGRVVLVIQQPHKMPSHKAACYHVTEPKIMDGTWRGKDTWDYIDGHTNKHPFNLHKGQLERKAKNAEQQAVQQAEIEENYKRRLAALKKHNEEEPIIPEAR